MDAMEKSSLKHAAEWLRYSRSKQAKIDADIDRYTRLKADNAAGHSNLCSLTKCHPTCKRSN